MKKSGMQRTVGDIDGGLTSMEPLANRFSLTIRVICYLLYHRQQRFLTYLTDNALYTEIYKVYISIHNR
jgi:hypothetical protein